MNEHNHDKADSEQQQTIADSSARFIHDIATPLANIQLISHILDRYMPVMLSAYRHLKNLDDQDKLTLEDIPPAHYQTLVDAAAQINDMARQVKIQSKQYWQKIDQQYSQNSGTGISASSHKASHQDNASHKHPRVASVSLTNHLRILVAEDDRLHQKIATKLLSQHHLDIVSNGQQVIEAVQQHSYDLLLMDLLMPVMSGQQAAAIISGAAVEGAVVEDIVEGASTGEIIDGLDKLPLIIGLTNKPLSSEEKQQLLAQGFQGILEKPLNMDDLNQLLNRLQQPQE